MTTKKAIAMFFILLFWVGQKFVQSKLFVGEKATVFTRPISFFINLPAHSY